MSRMVAVDKKKQQRCLMNASGIIVPARDFRRFSVDWGLLSILVGFLEFNKLRNALTSTEGAESRAALGDGTDFRSQV